MRRLILVFVLVAAILVGGYALFNDQKPEQEMIPVLFAVSDMSSGRFISQESVEVRPIAPSEYKSLRAQYGELVQQGAHKELQNFVPRRPIKKGDAIADKNLIRPSDPDFLPAVLKQGHRAVTVQLNDVTSGIGLYRPGNYVDVILTYTDNRAGNRGQGRVAVTMFRGLRILALGGDLGLAKTTQNDGNTVKKTSSVVTLEATPRQAEAIVLATKLGELSLSLRANEGQDTASEPTRTYGNEMMHVVGPTTSSKPESTQEPREPIKIRGLYGDQQRIITLE